MFKCKSPDGECEYSFKYVVRDTDRHGNERIYLRLKGSPKVRLTNKPGTTEFADEYKRLTESGGVAMRPRRLRTTKAEREFERCLQFTEEQERAREQIPSVRSAKSRPWNANQTTIEQLEQRVARLEERIAKFALQSAT